MTQINLCRALNCPHNDDRYGCRRYMAANHCHLCYEKPGQVRDGIVTTHGHPCSRHWVYITPDAGMAAFERAQDKFLSDPDEQRRIARTARFMEEIAARRADAGR